MISYYNEIDTFASKWLVNLSYHGHIAPGGVDSRSIADVRPEDFDYATQSHFFAGIGAWSYALRLAGWPDDEPVWTGSCPCQPFSNAGAGRGFEDERHLWPEWLRLIRLCRPPILFGEQVASRAGRTWLSVVRADLEALGYAVGAADLCAAGVGAPHIRQRIFFGAVKVADTHQERRAWKSILLRGEEAGRNPSDFLEVAGGGADVCGRVGHADDPRLEGRDIGRYGAGERSARTPGVGSPWAGAEYLPGRDGKHRPAQPGTFPLVDGAPARVGRVRGYGNCIVPQVAAAFVQSFVEAL